MMRCIRSTPGRPRRSCVFSRSSARFAGLPVALKRDASYRPTPKAAGVFAEEVLALGKIRIQYRSQPDKADYKLLRDYFESKLKSD